MKSNYVCGWPFPRTASRDTKLIAVSCLALRTATLLGGTGRMEATATSTHRHRVSMPSTVMCSWPRQRARTPRPSRCTRTEHKSCKPPTPARIAVPLDPHGHSLPAIQASPSTTIQIPAEAISAFRLSLPRTTLQFPQTVNQFWEVPKQDGLALQSSMTDGQSTLIAQNSPYIGICDLRSLRASEHQARYKPSRHNGVFSLRVVLS